MGVDDLLRLLANGVLALHAAVVAFVVGGLMLVVVGNACNWRWVNSPWFRVAHLAAIAIVVAEAWSGVTCPLTTLEGWLRAQGGYAGHRGGFVEHWLQRLLYYDAPPRVFVLAYSAFGLLVLFAWRRFPPVFGLRPPARQGERLSRATEGKRRSVRLPG